jgi:hypothetical protein
MGPIQLTAYGSPNCSSFKLSVKNLKAPSAQSAVTSTPQEKPYNIHVWLYGLIQKMQNNEVELRNL